MRFMMLVKHGEIQAPPPKEFLDAMAKLGEEAEKSGTMIASGGLSPIARERACPAFARAGKRGGRAFRRGQGSGGRFRDL